MKKLIFSLLILMIANANAQSTGDAAISASNAGSDKRWLFTTIAIAMIAGGVVSLSYGSANGSNVTSHFH